MSDIWRGTDFFFDGSRMKKEVLEAEKKMAESDAGSKRKWDDLRVQRDELKTTVQTQDKLISALGLDDDDDKVKRIKRILGMADKEGGLEELERRLDLFKQRQKSDYVAVVLGTAMSLTPNDVIGVTWAGDMFSIATVSAEPDPLHPLDLHIKLCLRNAAKQQISMVIKAEPQNVQRIHQSKLDHTLRRVLDESNLRKLHTQNGQGSLAEFRKRLWKDMRVAIHTRFPESHGQLISVEKALGLGGVQAVLYEVMI